MAKQVLAVLRLRLAVHARAFAHFPLPYLQAVVWRSRGLKLRARHRFSALLGQVTGAYELWMATREPIRLREIAGRAQEKDPPIDVVIDCRSGAGQLEMTIVSVREASPAHGGRIFVLGHVPTKPTIDAEVIAIPDPERFTPPTGRHVMSLAAGDRLNPSAFGIYRAAMAHEPGAAIYYADDDLIDTKGRRYLPHFKPRWNSELARHHDFISASSVQAPVQKGQATPASPPVHVPYVLHHRRSRPAPVIPQTPVSLGDGPAPHVSVIIPTRDQHRLLRKCLDGLARTDYPDLDVTVIDNGSHEPETLSLLAEAKERGVRVVSDPGPFNYATMHNRAVEDLAGPLLCLLNNDIEMIGADWLARMVPHAIRPDVGAVGARLLYPDRTIQHAGIVTGIGGGAAHAHRLQPAMEEGYFARASLPQFVNGVTAACLVVEKTKFLAVGGFDGSTFPVAFNDVDLCLKLNARGWQSFYEPGAELIHHESKSRGFDRRGKGRKRFAGELAALQARWGTDTLVDPFHHPELSPFSERFVVRL